MPVFIDVEYVRGWRLFLVLSDGTTGVLDLTPGEPSRYLQSWRASVTAPGSSSTVTTSWSGLLAARYPLMRSITSSLPSMSGRPSANPHFL